MSVPPLYTAAAAAEDPEELPLMVLLVSVVVPRLARPPPSPVVVNARPEGVVPSVIVSPEMDAVTSASTWNTRLRPAALTVTPLFGPVIVSVSLVLVSSSWVPVSVIVCAVLNTWLSKVICRVSRAIEVGEEDGFRQAQEARSREEAARRIHDQVREDRAGVRKQR